jgi:hypothetical protein
MAALRLAACATVAVQLCLVLSPSHSLRWLSDGKPESTAGHGHDSYRTAYHFHPANNWQNGTYQFALPDHFPKLSVKDSFI